MLLCIYVYTYNYTQSEQPRFVYNQEFQKNFSNLGITKAVIIYKMGIFCLLLHALKN